MHVASLAAASSPLSPSPGVRPTRSSSTPTTPSWNVVAQERKRRAVRSCLVASSEEEEEEDPSASSPAWEVDDGGVIFSAEQIARTSGGVLVREGPGGSISTDSRSILPGQWFVALGGDSFDGHAFLEDAARAGCAGAISSRPAPEGWDAGYVLVDDTLSALQRLAANVRDRFRGPVVGITGSVGKTTTRSLTALALRSYGNVHHTRGNLNNQIGVPLTLLRMPATAEVCVLELGMSGFGEIQRLAEICRPTIRVITNVAPVHLEGVGGHLEGVARAKGELFASAGAGDVCVVSADDDRVSSLHVPPECGVLSFGMARPEGEPQPDVAFDDVLSLALREVNFTLRSKRERASGDAGRTVVTSDGHRVTITEPGMHLAAAAAAAAAVAEALGLPLSDVCRDLSRYESLEMRMRVKEVPSRGIVCIDDAYNASPTSVRNALQTVFSAGQTSDAAAGGEERRTVVLLGDMLELGSASQRYHEEVVDACLDFGFDLVGLAGPEFTGATASVAARGRDTSDVVVGEDAERLWEKVKNAVDAGSAAATVLVKGSRGMRMDYIVERLTRAVEEEDV